MRFLRWLSTNTSNSCSYKGSTFVLIIVLFILFIIVSSYYVK
ncbi:YjcZ family sporulation protein [Paenisporosarcina antarctica]|uniref:YjcZ family sporulation protein n=1 Tax=Paenisporosarcina antarctica TaxID=417367 RepID=A0A4P6ZZF2_9BACL|nr:YjcZ family sporulation protein [Paenisporosarcina antarctica]QBP41684.1 YjcZ family sporulation protein [Paenisporosarcina antarctica]